ncbi:unnamed protein product [Sphenostylis stenocarpa]|uniref:Uncharacterized protein n=1 Tax=Sphenostylis stenocarpa TaxID=92480 RepID=A0AA86SRX3_9FABA|nr:unnamed protein product [Sphenostylis stenocarpa]
MAKEKGYLGLRKRKRKGVSERKERNGSKNPTNNNKYFTNDPEWDQHEEVHEHYCNIICP